MNPEPFIDIHTHKSKTTQDSIAVKYLFPNQEVYSFTGQNFYSVGLHPWFIKSKEENNDQLFLLKESLKVSHAIFVGECGLDPLVKTDFSEQIRVFEAQAFMAEEFRKPLIIHCVKVYNEVIGIHNRIQPKMPWIMHGYNGNLQTTKQMMAKNFLFSFGKMLFEPNSKALKSFQILPIDRIFFETDEYNLEIRDVYTQGAKIRDVEIEELQKKVWQNFNRLKNVKWTG